MHLSTLCFCRWIRLLVETALIWFLLDLFLISQILFYSANLETTETLGFFPPSWQIKFQSVCVSKILLIAPRCFTLLMCVGVYVLKLKKKKKNLWDRERDDFLAPRSHKSFNGTAFLPSTGWFNKALPIKPPPKFPTNSKHNQIWATREGGGSGGGE